jgi:hypothetical protein
MSRANPPAVKYQSASFQTGQAKVELGPTPLCTSLPADPADTSEI